MKKTLLLACCLFIIAGAGCQQTASPKNIAPQTQESIRKEVESHYANLLSAIDKKDYESFVGALKLPEAKQKPTKEQWLESLDIIKKMYAPLDEGEFKEIYAKDKKVYYFYLSNLKDEKYITLDILSFEKDSSGWKMLPEGQSHSFNKGEDLDANATEIAQKITEFKTKLDWLTFKPKYHPRLTLKIPSYYKIAEKSDQTLISKDEKNYLRITKRKTFEETQAEMEKFLESESIEMTESTEVIEPQKKFSTNSYDIEIYYDEADGSIKDEILLVAGTASETITKLNQ